MIDADSGNIHLPNGFVITPALTLDAFRQSWFGRNAAANRPPSLPGYCWFSEDAGAVELYPLSVQLSFQDQVLITASLTYKTQMTADETGEYDGAWANRKSIHDALLLTDLGEPDIYTDTSEDEPGLDKAPTYLRPWGKVISDFDCGGGDAYIMVEYDGREAQARDEQQRRKNEQKQQNADTEEWMATVVRQINNEN